MANRIVSVHAGIYGMGIYAIMLPSSGFLVAHSSGIPLVRPTHFALDMWSSKRVWYASHQG